MKTPVVMLGSALLLVVSGCGGLEVQGIVRDARSGEPLPNALVQIGDEQGVTNQDGIYQLQVDGADLERVRVFKTGYLAHEEAIPEGARTGDVSLERLKTTPAPPARSMATQLNWAHGSDEWLRLPSDEERRKDGLEPDARPAWDRRPN